MQRRNWLSAAMLATTYLVAGCGDTTNSDMAGMPDQTVILDMSVALDMTKPPDQTVPPDQTFLPDMTVPPDLIIPDLVMPDFVMPDFVMPDLVMPDLVKPPDLVMPDLVVRDLSVPPDLVPVPDLAKLPDLILADFKPLPDLAIPPDMVVVPDLAKPVTDVIVAPQGTLTFSPSSVDIKVGDTVRWTWNGNNHTVTSGTNGTADNLFCSPTDMNCAAAATSNAGFVYTHTFAAAGTFNYFCRPHAGAGMTGVVNVK